MLNECKFKKEKKERKKEKFCDKHKDKIVTSNAESAKILKSLEPISTNGQEGLLTGYYEPVIKAFSTRKKDTYPIYKNPKFIKKNLQFLSRKKINTGSLDNQGLEIAYIENEIEAFFLQIQGSGRLLLEDKSIIKVRFAGSNNKEYTSIGRVLIKKGFLKKEEISMYSIKNWLYKNPAKARKIMEENERFIFFETYDGKIKGSAGRILIPKVSVAIDNSYIEYGTPLIIQNANDEKDIFLAIAHDKGAAIKGKNRIDLFTGYGKKAESEAATLNKIIKVWQLKY